MLVGIERTSSKGKIHLDEINKAYSKLPIAQYLAYPFRCISSSCQSQLHKVGFVGKLCTFDLCFHDDAETSFFK